MFVCSFVGWFDLVSTHSLIVFFFPDGGRCVFNMATKKDGRIASTPFYHWSKYFCCLGTVVAHFITSSPWALSWCRCSPPRLSCFATPGHSAGNLTPSPCSAVSITSVNACMLRATPGTSHGLDKCVLLLLLPFYQYALALPDFSSLISKYSPLPLSRTSGHTSIQIYIALEHVLLFHALCLYLWHPLFLDCLPLLFFERFFWFPHRGGDF